MKHLYKRTVILLVVCAMASLTVLAATSTRKVTFNRVVTVNGTPVKAGTYKVRFDDATGEFTILDGKKVVAKATARLEKLEFDTQSSYSMKAEGESSVLVSIVMDSRSRAVIVSDAVITDNSVIINEGAIKSEKTP
jgi:hypothetical protein